MSKNRSGKQEDKRRSRYSITVKRDYSKNHNFSKPRQKIILINMWQLTPLCAVPCSAPIRPERPSPPTFPPPCYLTLLLLSNEHFDRSAPFLSFSIGPTPAPVPISLSLSLSLSLSTCRKIRDIWCVVRESLELSVSPCPRAHHRPTDHRRSLLEGTAARRLRLRLPFDSAGNRVMVFTFSRHPHRRASPLLGAFFFSKDLSRAFPDVLVPVPP